MFDWLRKLFANQQPKCGEKCGCTVRPKVTSDTSDVVSRSMDKPPTGTPMYWDGNRAVCKGPPFGVPPHIMSTGNESYSSGSNDSGGSFDSGSSGE